MRRNARGPPSCRPFAQNSFALFQSVSSQASRLVSRFHDEECAVATGTAGAKNDMKLALGTSRRLTMLHGIESWTLTNEDASPLPLNEDSIRDLAPEDADYIYAEINALNQPMTSAEKKAS